jgi:ribose transport system substrate-binding protein
MQVYAKRPWGRASWGSGGLAVALATLALAVAACGSDSSGGAGASGGKQINVAAFMIANNTYSQVMLKGIKDYAAQKHAKLTVFDSQFDPDRLFKQVEDAAATGKYQAFVIHVIDSNSIVPAVKDAISRGIAVAASNGVVGPKLNTLTPQVKGLAGQVFTPSTVRAEKLKDAVVTACTGISPCHVAFIAGDLSGTFDQMELQAIKSLPQSHPDISIAGTAEGKYDPGTALKDAQDLYTRTKDVQVVAVAGDQMAPAGLQATNEAGLKGKVRIVSIGASESAVKAVRDGQWYSTITHVPYDEGKIAAELAIDQAMGHPHKVKGIDPVVASHVPLNLSRANLSDWKNFKAQWTG